MAGRKRLQDIPADTTFKDARTIGKEYRSQELIAVGKRIPKPKEKMPLVVTRER